MVELSDTLRRLPIHSSRPRNFRSPSSVNRKLGNFAAVDPDFPGAGLDAGGRLDRAVFAEFQGRAPMLAATAAQIRASAR